MKKDIFGQANSEQSPSTSQMNLSEAGRLYSIAEKSFYNGGYAEAARLYQQAAELGSAAAQYSIGFMYQHGMGVSRDYAEAEKWFLKAVAQGNTEARNALEVMRREGSV